MFNQTVLAYSLPIPAWTSSMPVSIKLPLSLRLVWRLAMGGWKRVPPVAGLHPFLNCFYCFWPGLAGWSHDLLHCRTHRSVPRPQALRKLVRLQSLVKCHSITGGRLTAVTGQLARMCVVSEARLSKGAGVRGGSRHPVLLLLPV